jgi:MFS family permease
MVMDFELTIIKSETGKWIGKISSWFFIGEFLSYPIFIWASRRFGCRLVLLFSIVATSLLSLYLGSVDDYDSLLTIRFFQGLLCPVPLVTSRFLQLSFTDQAKVRKFNQRFSLAGLSLGFCIGGALQGESFLGESRFLLSGFCVFLAGFVCFLTCYLYVKEEPSREDASILSIFIEIVQILKNKELLYPGIVFLLAGVAGIVLELMLLWMWALTDDGGFNVSLGDLWRIMTFASLPVLAYVWVYYQAVVDKLGNIQTCKESLKFAAACLLVFPIFSIANTNFTAMYISFIFGGFLFFTAHVISLNTIQNVLTDQAGDNQRVQAPEVWNALGNIVKALAVRSACASFAKNAKKDNDYPFNFSYPFNVLAVTVFLACVCCSFLSDRKRTSSSALVLSSHESLLEHSSENFEIPVKINELKPMSSK